MHAIAYLLITILALVLTAGYTADLEMGWLAVWLLVPAWALVLGAVVSLVVGTIRKTSWAGVAGIVAFSVAIHSALMFEEAYLSLIRHRFDAIAEELNDAERAKVEHAVELGGGGILYYKRDRDESFRLNFEIDGKRSVDRGEIVTLAKEWLNKKGYQPYGIKLLIEPPIYRKSVFSMGGRGRVILECESNNQTVRDGHRIKALYLDLIRKDRELTFTETGWVSAE